MVVLEKENVPVVAAQLRHLLQLLLELRDVVVELQDLRE